MSHPQSFIQGTNINVVINQQEPEKEGALFRFEQSLQPSVWKKMLFANLKSLKKEVFVVNQQ